MLKSLKAVIFLKHKASNFAKWATTKPMSKKIKTGDPMIKTDNYDYNKIIKDPSKQFKTKFKYKKRREILKNKNNFTTQISRKWNKASPLGKVGYTSALVAPKAAFVGAGYFLNRQDDKE
jgi:hypothetical protein